MLTEQEEAAIDLAGQLYTLLEEIVGNGDTREADLRELAASVHVIQRAVMAQVVARQRPYRFRLLGGRVMRVPEVGGEG